VLNEAVSSHPSSGRLLVLRGKLFLEKGDPAAAVESFFAARNTNADAAEVERLYSCSLHMSGAALGECISAYLVAITLNPNDANLRLNLAQLMFLKGEDTEANRYLYEALKLGLDDSAQLEAQFYLLAHTASPPLPIIERIKLLLSGEARLRWNVMPNIEKVRLSNPRKALTLDQLAQAMAMCETPETLDALFVGQFGD